MNDPKDLTDTFFLRWANACGRLGIDPFDLIRVAYSESGCRASAHNKHGNASGLIQFMPNTLLSVGWTKGHEAFRLLPAEEQVQYVERYYRPWCEHCKSAGLCYVATFLPALTKAAAKEGSGFVLCGLKGPLSWAYQANTVLDRNNDGRITVGDLEEHIERQCKGSRYNAILWRLRQAMGLEPPDLPPVSEPPQTLRPQDLMTTRGVQHKLKELGFDPGPVDGLMGPRTKAAIIGFQAANGLKPDGIVGPKTLAALQQPNHHDLYHLTPEPREDGE